MVQIKFTHPRSDDPAKSREFAAQGFAAGAFSIVGKLLPQGGGPTVRGQTLVEPLATGYWVIQFALSDEETKKKYILHVEAKDMFGDPVAKGDVEFSIQPTYEYGWGMTWPTSGNVYAQFAPYGSQDERSLIAASLSPADPNFAFTQISNTPTGWTISCTASVNNNETLSVSKPDMTLPTKTATVNIRPNP